MFTNILNTIYGPTVGHATRLELERIIAAFKPHATNISLDIPTAFNHTDAILIVYGDHLTRSGESPLKTLASFLNDRLAGIITGIHILPFYPFTSDDGFSVQDYRRVDPRLGDWSQVRDLAQKYRLMFDGVINHCSTKHNWFQRFLQNDPLYNDYFILPDEDWDISNVVRPRTSPLLTTFPTAAGQKKVWTTFSADQVDLNYAHPKVLLETIEILLFYVAQGASIIRLDAIAYLWKKPGSTCINLPETHLVIKLLRAVLDVVDPHVNLITETNIPHRENSTYFGDLKPSANSTDEAQLVYQFALAPLVLHTFYRGNSKYLTDWASQLTKPPAGTWYFNIIASHDGIGFEPVREILSADEICYLAEQVTSRGGSVSLKRNQDGTTTPYELNITLTDALADPGMSIDSAVAPLLASQAILLSLAGIPGIYFNSLFGCTNYFAGQQSTGHPRTLNREKFYRDLFEKVLDDPETVQHKIFKRYKYMLTKRRQLRAFHPDSDQVILNLGEQVFSLIRTDKTTGEQVLCIINITSRSLEVDLHPPHNLNLETRSWVDQIDGNQYLLDHATNRLALSPYQVLWLTPDTS